MKITKYLLISILLGISMVVSACGPKVEPTPTVDPIAIMTQVAKTVQAEVTKMAALTPSPTAPLPPTATLPPVPTQAPPAVPTTPARQPTLPASSPDNAKWIADVTVIDDTVFWKNEKFTKTWKIENTGTTTWDTTYKLVYVDGPVLGETLIVSITSPVKPKNQIEISVPMKAPTTLGTITNYWRMMNGKGQFFGDVLYVKIIVGTEAQKTATPSG
jgi:hypothetical protein